MTILGAQKNMNKLTISVRFGRVGKKGAISNLLNRLEFNSFRQVYTKYPLQLAASAFQFHIFTLATLTSKTEVFISRQRF